MEIKTKKQDVHLIAFDGENQTKFIAGRGRTARAFEWVLTKRPKTLYMNRCAGGKRGPRGGRSERELAARRRSSEQESNHVGSLF
jgi:hypothetical protein